MVSLWRFTRNRYARAVYDALQAVGITATRMYEYQVRVDHHDTAGSRPAPDGVTIEVVSVSEVRARGIDLDFSLPVDLLDGELVVIASADGNPIGRMVINPGPTPYVHPLERPVTVPGAYIRKVFVVPERRGQGVASAALRAAVAHAQDEFEAEHVTALIAADNSPSQWLFESCGFERVRAHEYVRVGPLSRYRTRAI